MAAAKRSQPSPSQPASSDSTDDAASSPSSFGEEEQEVTRMVTGPPAPIPTAQPAGDSDSSSGDDEGEEDDEDKGSEEGESEDDDDVEEEKEAVADKSGSAASKAIQPQKQQQSKPALKNSDSLDSDDDSGEGSSSASSASDEAPSRSPEPSVKPISSRPMYGSPTVAILLPDQQHNKRKLEEEEDHIPTRAKIRGRDRALQEETPSRRNPDASAELENSDDRKRPLFQKLWSSEDVEVILSGLVEHREKNGTLPVNGQDMITFLNYLQGKLKIKITKSQLQDKVRRLKKKFETNAARIRKNVDYTIGDTHEQIVYELSKSLWDSKETKPKGKVKGTNAEEDENHSDSDQDTEKVKEVSRRTNYSLSINENAKRSKLEFPYLWESVDKMVKELSCEVAIKKSFEMMNTEYASVLDERVKKLKIKEIKLHLRKIDLLKEVTKLILDGLSAME